MLCLLGVMLAVMCLASPVPPTRGTACPASPLFRETIQHLRDLNSKGSSEITPLNNIMKVGDNATTYLEGFIKALNHRNMSREQELLVLKLKKIQAYGESCTGWKSALKEHHWKAVEDYDFFDNLEYLLRFLGHNALPE